MSELGIRDVLQFQEIVLTACKCIAILPSEMERFLRSNPQWLPYIKEYSQIEGVLPEAGSNPFAVLKEAIDRLHISDTSSFVEKLRIDNN